MYGVDVGYGQVAEKIRQDERVVIMERTNLRYVTELPDAVDIVTLDLSFISVLKVLPAICRLLKPGGTMVVLIKPQFEARRNQIGSKGVVGTRAAQGGDRKRHRQAPSCTALSTSITRNHPSRARKRVTQSF